MSTKWQNTVVKYIRKTKEYYNNFTVVLIGHKKLKSHQSLLYWHGYEIIPSQIHLLRFMFSWQHTKFITV